MLKKNPFVVPSAPIPRATPPIGELWIHELKFDGYRLQIHKHGNDVALFSRNGNDFTKRFAGIVDAVRKLPVQSAIIDAEIVACNGEGLPSFTDLVRRSKVLCVWCFDLLEYNGQDTRRLKLLERKAKLGGMIAAAAESRLRYSGEFFDPIRLLAAAEEMELEGIVSKRVDQAYRSGKNPQWVKVKTNAWRQANRFRAELFAKMRP